MKKIAPKAMKADDAAGVIVRSILGRKPQGRLLVGADAKIIAALRAVLPLSWFDAILKRELGIGGRPVAHSG